MKWALWDDTHAKVSVVAGHWKYCISRKCQNGTSWSEQRNENSLRQEFFKFLGKTNLMSFISLKPSNQKVHELPQTKRIMIGETSPSLCQDGDHDHGPRGCSDRDSDDYFLWQCLWKGSEEWWTQVQIRNQTFWIPWEPQCSVRREGLRCPWYISLWQGLQNKHAS